MMKKEKETIVIYDMSRMDPVSALSPNYDKYTWRILEYETEDFSGKMISANWEAFVPEICMHLSLNGWYHIYFGLFAFDNEHKNGICVKLEGEDASTFICHDKATHHPMLIEEAYWKSVDLSGKKLIFTHPRWGYPVSSHIAFIKCVPLSDEEVEKIKKDRERKDTKRLIAMNDMTEVLMVKRPINKEAFLEEIKPYEHTDFGSIHLEYWGDGGKDAEYSEHKGMYGNGAMYERIRDKNFCESKMLLKSAGIDYYREMLNYARIIGLKVYLSQRMNAFVSEVPYDTVFTSAFYRDFPQWRCKERDGTEIARMSLAYPEVQDNFLKTIQKMASYSPDGISLLFNRGMPFMLYEKPLIDGFTIKYGQDPRVIDENDERWLDFKCDVMTLFLRRIRETLDTYSKMQEIERIRISVHGLANGEQNKLFGLDIGRWAREELVNEVVAYPISIISPNTKTSSECNVIPIDVEYYVNQINNTKCKIFIDMLPREMEPDEYRIKAIDYYAKGVDGLCFWDTFDRYPKLRKWSMISRLGHKDDLPEIDSGEGKYYRTIKVIKIDGIRVDRYPPVWGL